MNFGSVCSGIEAASVAWDSLGWSASWFAEIEPFPSAVLAHHYPDVPNLGDMATIARRVLTSEVDAPDVLCGDTPCQAFSVAGLRNSLEDARGNLTLKFVGIANAIDFIRAKRGQQPATVFWENVPGVLNTKDNAFGCFLAGLAGEDDPLIPPREKWANAGCVFGPKRAVAWRVLDAQYFGVAQRRRRVFVVASARKGFDPAQVLFEFDGVRRDSAPSRETRQEIAGTLASRTGAGGFPGTDEACSGYLQPVNAAYAVCTAQTSANGHGIAKEVTHTLDQAQGQAVCVPALSVALRGRDGGATAELGDEVAGCLRASSGGGDKPHVLAPIAFDTTQITSQANRSNPLPGDPCHPLAAGAHAPAIAYAIQAGALRTNPNSGPDGAGVQSECAYTMEARAEVQCVALVPSQVRRLTPEECEKLQGFLPGYTAIPWRGKPADQCPDGPRYKALGNSWAVPNVRWIGKRINAAILRLEHANDNNRSEVKKSA